MKKVFLSMMVLVYTAVLLLAVPVSASSEGIQPRYSYTSAVTANLQFSGSSALCSGSVIPSGKYAVTVTVTLYKQNGSNWDYVASWSGSATGGNAASASGSASVGSGTYKVVTRGNVAYGMEFPSKSVTRTK